MTQYSPLPKKPHLVWIYAGSLAEKLDAATWLDTTRELRRMGWQVTLINVGKSGRQRLRSVEVLNMSMPKIYLVRQLVYHAQVLFWILRRWRQIDVVMFHQISAPWMMPLRLLRTLTRRSAPRFVIDIRTVHMEPLANEPFKARLRRKVFDLVNKWGGNLADGYTAITAPMAKVLGISPPLLWGVWPSGVNLKKFSGAPRLRQWPLPGEPIQLVYIGSLHYERNLMALCRAVESANASGLRFNLLLIGDGTARADLESFANQTSGHVGVLPPVAHEEIPALLAQAHVGVLPFPDEEKFRVSSPIKLFEYMASGLVILASRITCHTDVIGDGEYVFWAERTDEEGLLSALRQIHASEAAWPHLSERAIQAAETWTWEAAAEKLHNALRHGLAGYHGVHEKGHENISYKMPTQGLNRQLTIENFQRIKNSESLTA